MIVQWGVGFRQWWLYPTYGCGKRRVNENFGTLMKKKRLGIGSMCLPDKVGE
jgi:hypothetical protein